MHSKPRLLRTVAAGLTGGLAFVLGTFVTFAQFSGSRQGDTGLLFSPDTQHAKVIAVWKEIEPLPRVIVQPSIILAGMVIFAIAYAFLYRSIAAAWPTGMTNRTWRLASIVWVAAVFSDFMGPFNVLHQPLRLSVIAWGFWAVPALLEALAIVAMLDRSAVGSSNR